MVTARWKQTHVFRMFFLIYNTGLSTDILDNSRPCDDAPGEVLIHYSNKQQSK